MKLLLAQPAIPYLQWQLEVLLVNLRQFDHGLDEIILLFTEHDFTVPSYFRQKYPECSVHVYSERDNRSYIPSVRPYLWWKYLSEDPSREADTYIYVDADIIFREWPHFATLAVSDKRWVGSHCKGYIGYDEYLKNLKNSEAICARLAEITGVTMDQLKAAPPAGAQWVIQGSTADYWKRVYDDSNTIHAYFDGLDSDIQKWTAEMWAQLYGAVREGVTVEISPELDFCMPTDDVKRWDEVKILHNAGVHGPGSIGMFYKGGFVDQPPFHQNFSRIRQDKATIKYVDAIKKVVQ